MPLLIHELIHLSTSAAVGFYSYYRFGDWKLIFLSLIFGFLIDLDHLFDYFYYLCISFKAKNGGSLIKDFFRPKLYVSRTKKVFVPLHGWEYLLIFWVVGGYFEEKIPGIRFAIVSSYFFHLFFDQVISARTSFSYFLIYRVLHRFNLLFF